MCQTFPPVSFQVKDNEPIITTHGHAFEKPKALFRSPRGRRDNRSNFSTRQHDVASVACRVHTVVPRETFLRQVVESSGPAPLSSPTLGQGRLRRLTVSSLPCRGVQGLSRKWVQRLTRTRGSCLTRCSFPLLISGNQRGEVTKFKLEVAVLK